MDLTMHPMDPNRAGLVWALVALLIFQAISAIPPGLLLVVDPSGGYLGMSVEILRGSAFSDFRIPGLLLFCVIGLGALVVGGGLCRQAFWPFLERMNPVKRQRWPWFASLVYGFGVMVWIVVEFAIIGFGSWLQPLYFAVGFTILVLPFAPSVRKALSATGCPSREGPGVVQASCGGDWAVHEATVGRAGASGGSGRAERAEGEPPLPVVSSRRGP